MDKTEMFVCDVLREKLKIPIYVLITRLTKILFSKTYKFIISFGNNFEALIWLIL